MSKLGKGDRKRTFPIRSPLFSIPVSLHPQESPAHGGFLVEQGEGELVRGVAVVFMGGVEDGVSPEMFQDVHAQDEVAHVWPQGFHDGEILRLGRSGCDANESPFREVAVQFLGMIPLQRSRMLSQPCNERILVAG